MYGSTTGRNRPTLPDESFAAQARALEEAYLQSADPMMQSGFSGGRRRWVSERSPLIDAIHRDGDLLDVGCANGLLAEDAAAWARERGFEIVPHGIDLGERLIAVAHRRMPEHCQNFKAADAWTWKPERKSTFVYSLLDLSPREMWSDWLHRLSTWVEPEGRLIIGSYGSRSRAVEPLDVADVMERCGLRVIGSSRGGDPPLTCFAWSER
jgi:SAM-dependent methyltransferase